MKHIFKCPESVPKVFLLLQQSINNHKIHVRQKESSLQRISQEFWARIFLFLLSSIENSTSSDQEALSLEDLSPGDLQINIAESAISKFNVLKVFAILSNTFSRRSSRFRKDTTACTGKVEKSRRSLVTRGNAYTTTTVVQAPFAWISMEVNKTANA